MNCVGCDGSGKHMWDGIRSDGTQSFTYCEFCRYEFHVPVEMHCPFLNESVAIDKGIAGDIQACWDRGIQTLACCEGAGEPYIMFETLPSDLSFLRPGIRCCERYPGREQALT